MACFGQQTKISATIIDPAGHLYQFLTGSASINCPGGQAPLYNGYTVPRNFPITGGDGNGTFSLTLYDVNVITPSGCSYNFAITASNGTTNFIAPSIGGSASATPITGTGPVNLSTAINAYAVLLPSTGGSGGSAFPVTVSGTVNSGGIPCFNSTTNEESSAALTQYAPVIGGGAGACVGQVAPGTTNGTYVMQEVVSGSAATAPTLTLVGLVVDQAAGANVLYSDNNNIQYNPAASLTFPTPPNLGNANFFTSMILDANAVSLTPTTPWNFAVNGAAALTSQTAASLLRHTGCILFINQVTANQANIHCTDTQGYINGTAFAGTSGHLVSFGANNIPADSGVVAANVLSAAQYKTITCEGGLGDGKNAIASGTYNQTTCYNGTGASITITGIKVYVNAGTASTIAISGNTLGNLINAATYTIGTAGSYQTPTQSSNVTLTSTDYIKFQFVADGTATQVDWVITGTY